MEMYIVSVGLLPTKKDAEDGKTPKVIVPAYSLYASNREQARIMAIRNLSPEYADIPSDRLEVAVMSFPGRA